MYVVNMQSYIDVLWLASRYAPTFARVSAQGGLTRLSTLGALGMATGTIATSAPKEGAETSTMHTLQWARSTFAGPLVLFAEGAPTNGKVSDTAPAMSPQPHPHKRTPEFPGRVGVV